MTEQTKEIIKQQNNILLKDFQKAITELREIYSLKGISTMTGVSIRWLETRFRMKDTKKFHDSKYFIRS